MVAAIRQTIKVEQDGRIEIRSPELRPGATAEVIVLVEQDIPYPRPELLDEIQRKLKLSPEAARAWADQVRQERRESSRILGEQAE